MYMAMQQRVSTWLGQDQARVKSIIILVFALLLVLPGARMLIGPNKHNQIPENRRLAEWPNYTQAKSTVQYFDDLQTWFSEHFGARKFYIKLKTQLEYSLFNYSTQIHIGNGDWMYYRSNMDYEEPGIQTLPISDDQILAGVEKLNHQLVAKGITLIVMIAPMKDKLYPEYLPSSVQRLPSPSRFSKLYARLQQVPDLMFVDTIGLLEKTKQERPVFHRTDFHWNEPAAFVVSKWIVDTLSSRAGLKQSAWQHPLVIDQQKFSGGQAMALPLFKRPSELALFVKPSWDEKQITESSEQPPFITRYSNTRKSPPLLQPIAVLGDSFFYEGTLRAGFAAAFTTVHMTTWNNTDTPKFIAALPAGTRYVMIESIEGRANFYTDLADMSK